MRESLGEWFLEVQREVKCSFSQVKGVKVDCSQLSLYLYQLWSLAKLSCFCNSLTHYLFVDLEITDVSANYANYELSLNHKRKKCHNIKNHFEQDFIGL